MLQLVGRLKGVAVRGSEIVVLSLLVVATKREQDWRDTRLSILSNEY
jgi:hypothetical protein